MSEYINRIAFIIEATKNKAVKNGSAGIEDICKIADNAPADDVMPVIHGYWILDPDDKCVMPTCCECGFYISKRVYKPEDATPPYCPHCGAIMDRGVRYNDAR